MQLKQLIAEARRRSDDGTDQPLVSDETYAPLATEAQEEACIRASLLYDDTTLAVTQYPVAIAGARVELHAAVDRIISAEYAQTGGRRYNMDLVGPDWIRDQCDWRSRTSSRPGFLSHIDRGHAQLWPSPSIAGTLYLVVYRLPLEPLEALEQSPEIDRDHHMGLVDWMLYRVYSDQDGEVYNPERAVNALQAFEDRFGERPSADVRRRHRERRRVTTGCL